MSSRIKALGILQLVVAAASIVLAIVLALVVRGVVEHQEKTLLRDRGAEIAATLQISIANFEASLPLVEQIAELDRSPTKSAFKQATAALAGGSPGTSVGLAQVDGDSVRIVATTAKGSGTDQVASGELARLLRRAAGAKALASGIVKDASGMHFIAARRGPKLVAYTESPIDPTRPIPKSPGSPYNDLDVAVYAAATPDPSRLLITTTGRPPSGGDIDRRVLPVGSDRWLLLTKSTEPLTGQFATDLPWVILAGALLVALLMTALVSVVSRRRVYAMTEVARRTAEIRAAQVAAEAANQAKSDFLSRMSHELRTPLNAILGFGQVLELDGLDADQQDSVDHIMKGGRHLLGLVDEILDIARIEAGTMTISVEPVEVASALGDVIQLVGPLADERDIELQKELPRADDAFVLADRQRLRQVLLNLLSNAVKYNHEGGWVRVSVGETEDGKIQIRVADSGDGIPTDKMHDLFMPFERLGAELGATSGTGLGLALSKGLMERMGGSIHARNADDGGAVFTIELPRAASVISEDALERAALAGDEQPQLGACTILYIEDSPANTELIERVLAPQRGIRLMATQQGSLGLELAEQHLPDVILLDLHLPDLPGAEVFARLRAQPATRDIPVVVVSADATDAQVKRLLRAGAADYLTKPLDIQAFLEVVKRYARRDDEAGTAQPEPAESA